MADKNVAFRMDMAEYQKVKAAWELAGFERLQEAGLHAFRTAFEAEPSGTVPAKYRHLQKILTEILSSGDESLIGLVATPLELALKLVKRNQALRVPKDGK